MVPTAQPPPSVQSADTAITTKPPLDEIIHKLHNFILQIPLPKTKTAKTAAIRVEALHAICNLAISAWGSLPDHQETSMLSKVSSQLDMITAHLGIPMAPISDGKCTYAAALTAGTHGSAPVAHPSPNPNQPATPPPPPPPPPPHPPPPPPSAGSFFANDGRPPFFF